MKIALCVMSLVAVVSCSTFSFADKPIIDLDVIARMTAQELDQLAGGLAAEELIRTKRSGSGDILGQVTKSLSSGLTSKLSLLGSASAGASSLFSGGSSKSHSSDHGYEYGPPMMVHTKSFDFWTLKSSILNTLFQAVKAITGGVTILKGQLLKGGGALVSGVGRIVSNKGESVTNLGRNIVNSASLIPKKSSHASAPIHVTAPAVVHHSVPSGPSGPVASYGPPSGPPSHYSAPPAIHYEGPSAPAPTYQYGPPSHNAIYSAPTKYASPFEGRGKAPHGAQAGFILLQPIDSSSNIASDSHGAPTGPPSSFVSTALQALKGIIASAGGGQSGHSTGHGATGPSAQSHTSDTLYHPPPPPISSSYNSYSNDIPSFKPLTAPSGGDHSNTPVNSYGVPISSHDTSGPASNNFQAMVDNLVVSQMKEQGPSFDSYLQSFPQTQSGYNEVQQGQWKQRSLSPLTLSKINANIDKLNERIDRNDGSILSHLNLYRRMALAKEDANKEDLTYEEVSETMEEATTTTTTEAPEEYFDSGVRTHVGIEKSISYELRGNRIVRLTDGIADV